MNVDKFGRYTYTGMTIDKFGRHQTRERLRGPKGDGFKLTEQGDYDIENKRLVNVSDPASATDGVNFKTVQSQLSSCIRLNGEDLFDARHRRICNVNDPVRSTDVLTKGYYESQPPYRFDETSSYSFHEYKLQNVGNPVDDGDAVNLRYVNSKTIVESKDGVWNADSKRVTNVGLPQKDNDAVTKAYLVDKIPQTTTEGWDFSNGRLQRIGTPVELSDAVNLNYTKENCLSKLTEGKNDARYRNISNLAKPQELDDAVSKRYLKAVLADMGYALYKSINHKVMTQPIAVEVWKNNVMETRWEDLFNGVYHF